jgi:fatty acid-binding protein DegV
MNKVAILIDSSFGIKNNQYPNVFVVPLEIIETKDGQVKTYQDGVDITNTQICETIKNGGDVKTAQPIIGEVMKLMDKLSNEYEKVFALPITSKLSKTYEM